MKLFPAGFPAGNSLNETTYAYAKPRGPSLEEPLGVIILSHSGATAPLLPVHLHCHQRKSLCKVAHVRAMVLLSTFQNEDIIHRDAEQVA